MASLLKSDLQFDFAGGQPVQLEHLQLRIWVYWHRWLC